MSAKRYKLQVFIPTDQEKAVRTAIGEAGGGVIGNYDNCISVTKSIGYFRPLPGAKPAVGKVGKINEVEEVKLEFQCEKKDIPNIIRAIDESNIYEENAIDIMPIIDRKDFK